MPKVYKNLLVFSIILFCFGIFMPLSVDAVVDQRCWQKDACETMDPDTHFKGVFFGPTPETIAACGMDKDASGKAIGFCKVTGDAVTQVGFGMDGGSGKRTFTHIGNFIQWMYRYGIMAAAILAMVMIVVSGLSWILSAGSPEKITQAKKRIGNALMGLFVAVMSYFILNTVNPYLVNLRLPQVWKLNTIGLVPAFCDEIKDGKKLSETPTGVFDIEPKDAVCGKDYFVEGTGGDLTCMGSYCKDGNVCIPFDVVKNEKDEYEKIDTGYCSSALINIHYVSEPSARTYFKASEGTFQKAGSKLEAALDYRLDTPNWIKGDGRTIIICANTDGKTYVDRNDPTTNWHFVTIMRSKGDQKDYEYYEYFLQYDDKSLYSGKSGGYSCSKVGYEAVGFYLQDKLMIDLKVQEPLFYLSAKKGDKVGLEASRWGGVEGGSWMIPFKLFEKNG